MNTVFAGMDYLLAQALASLGFIVVLIEGRGTPLREKSFQDYHYGDLLYANNFEDRISGIRQLAERYSYMDIDRVGKRSSKSSAFVPINALHVFEKMLGNHS